MSLTRISYNQLLECHILEQNCETTYKPGDITPHNIENCTTFLVINWCIQP
jgi:hypothetical protein